MTTDWAEAYTNLRESLGLETDEPIPKLQRPHQGQAITTGADANDDSPAAVHARAAAAYIPFLTAEMLMPPKMPTTEETEKVLLDLRKKALVDEYFGDEGS